MLKSLNVNRRGAFVLAEALIALVLASSACVLVSGATQQMNQRLRTEQKRTDQARHGYEVSSQQLGKVMYEKEHAKARFYTD
ncbi:MAG TPA: hypothetical protein DCW31_03350 [Lactobacillus sp.]|nr:hypothetical protein [Lactobacillus sp.]